MKRLRNSLKINKTFEDGSWPVGRSAWNKELSMNLQFGVHPFRVLRGSRHAEAWTPNSRGFMVPMRDPTIVQAT